jgi:nucleoside-diphosphate-sugar epimerase
MANKVKILLIGSSGFIGQSLLPKLKDHKVTLYDKREGHDIFDPALEEYVN